MRGVGVFCSTSEVAVLYCTVLSCIFVGEAFLDGRGG